MKSFLKYLGIGGISTLIQFLLLTLFAESKLIPVVVASAMAYILSSIFNYFANYHFTFTSNLSHSKTLPKFIAAVGLGLASNTLLFALFYHFLKNYFVAQFLATSITVFLNFLSHKLWIYKDQKNDK
jgi:putative flippase GtrA